MQFRVHLLTTVTCFLGKSELLGQRFVWTGIVEQACFAHKLAAEPVLFGCIVSRMSVPRLATGFRCAALVRVGSRCIAADETLAVQPVC